jgi:hypothetical protein
MVVGGPKFKRSKVRLHPETKAVVDSGYQGLQRVHANTAMPKKRSKKNPLAATDKARNRATSSERALRERHRHAQTLQDYR